MNKTRVFTTLRLSYHLVTNCRPWSQSCGPDNHPTRKTRAIVQGHMISSHFSDGGFHNLHGTSTTDDTLCVQP